MASTIFLFPASIALPMPPEMPSNLHDVPVGHHHSGAFKVLRNAVIRRGYSSLHPYQVHPRHR